MPTDFRAAHEEYGRRALEEGRALHCSEPTVTNAVIEMTRVHLTNAANILDVGCGANLDYDYFLADMGKRPICVDFAMSFLRLAPKDARIRLVQADATFLPFAHSAFDGAICSETIEHIERDDAVIAEMARVLRPGGVLVITVPNLWNASRLLEMVKQRDFTIRMMTGHLREYTPSHLRSLLRPYFTVEEWLPVPFGWTGKVGGPIDWLVRIGVLKRFSKSIAFVARLNRTTELSNLGRSSN
jgi:2-polyprenyl-3-methyl-5-hydroxy-6-metoxy-1,4-benzoquinol methylase